MRRSRNPQQVHQPIAGYTHQIEVTGTPRWLVLSGQLGRTLAGTVPTDPIEQLTLALDNLRANLDAAGMEITDLVKLTLYLVGDLDAERRKHALTDRLGGHRPCLTLLFVAGLAAPEYRVEIDAWAAREDYPNSVAGSAATD